MSSLGPISCGQVRSETPEGPLGKLQEWPDEIPQDISSRNYNVSYLTSHLTGLSVTDVPSEMSGKPNFQAHLSAVPPIASQRCGPTTKTSMSEKGAHELGTGSKPYITWGASYLEKKSGQEKVKGKILQSHCWGQA
jgi:hypothetical protein